MVTERIIRGIAGSFVLLSVSLGYFVSPYWLLLAAFVGLNLFQSAFTKWCPLEIILHRIGVQDGKSSARDQSIVSAKV